MRFQELQDSICKTLEEADGGGKFREDAWERPGGGGGRSRIIEGNIIEKGGVNFSAVFGSLPENISKALEIDASEFYATGVSIVLHPKNPMVPIIHMNVRYFETDGGYFWFGGGIDLTPHYIDREDAAYFHGKLREVCDKHSPDYYPRFKQWADDYFYIKHRRETRGIGGIFFDRLSGESTEEKTRLFDFVWDVGSCFAPLYAHFMRKNSKIPFGEPEKEWQLLRRGRYAEFNLVYDKGTKFGLDTEGRIESILMSLPPVVYWRYDHRPEPDSREAETLSLLRKGMDWLNPFSQNF